MNEKLVLTDEEFEKIRKYPWYDYIINCLIATVESLKKQYNNAHGCAVLAEEEILALEKEVESLKKENAKLEAELNKRTKAINEFIDS